MTSRYSNPELRKIARKISFHKQRRQVNSEMLLDPKIKPKTRAFCEAQISYQTGVIKELKLELERIRAADSHQGSEQA
jgi:hypothetical protein